MKKFFLLILLPMLGSIVANAYDAEIDGIYYNFKGNNAEVTEESESVSITWRTNPITKKREEIYNNYSGVIVIPKSVTYNGEKYKVTSIGKSAFSSCCGLTSITIPNSVTVK